MKINGGCHCGTITYEAELDTDKVVICHCTDCQKLSGSAFRTVGLVKGEDFKIGPNAPKIYVRVADSGNERAMAFCSHCGAEIYATSTDENPEQYNIRLGTCDQRDQLVPKKQVWHGSAMSWLPELPGVEKV